MEKSSSNVIPQRSPDPSTLPMAPSEPKLINVSSTSITLGWSKVQLKQGGTSFFGYTVEYFSSDVSKTWITAAQRVPSNVVTVSWFNISFDFLRYPIHYRIELSKENKNMRRKMTIMIIHNEYLHYTMMRLCFNLIYCSSVNCYLSVNHY